MAKLWDDVVKWLDDASKVVGKEAGDLTQKGRLKVEIFDLKRKLRESFSELGYLVYEMAFIRKIERWKTNLKIKNLVKKIKMAKRNLRKKELEYQKVGVRKK